MLSVLVLCALATLSLSPSLRSQTLLDHNAVGATVFETTGPPAACGFPTGPFVAAFPTLAPFAACPGTAGPAPFVVPFIGDVATNRATNTIWVTDGFTFTEYVGSGPAYGTPVRNFVLPLGLALPAPVTGMDVVMPPFVAAPILLVTDGALVAGILPPPRAGLRAAAIAIPAFPVPGGLMTDLAWSPTTGSFWVCNAAGIVSNWLLGGAPGPGGIFPRRARAPRAVCSRCSPASRWTSRRRTPSARRSSSTRRTARRSRASRSAARPARCRPSTRRSSAFRPRHRRSTAWASRCIPSRTAWAPTRSCCRRP
jgi:hypothetical protein